MKISNKKYILNRLFFFFAFLLITNHVKANCFSSNQANSNSCSLQSDGTITFNPCDGQTLCNNGDPFNYTSCTSQIPLNGIFSWDDLNPSSFPTARMSSAMAADSCNGQIILFGGLDSFTYNNETWQYDVKTNLWTILNPPNPLPAPRTEAAMIFDPCTGQFILFGGFSAASGQTYYHDTWAFDIKTSTWTNLGPSNFPSARMGASMEFDLATGQIILFGGYNGSIYFDDTWTFDVKTNTWINLTTFIPTPPPSARTSASMVFDSCSGQIVLFGGYISSPNLEIFNDTWTFNTTTQMWALLNPSNPPFPRRNASMVFDSCSGQIILFGGFNELTYFNETWGLDTQMNEWTNLTTSITISPPERGFASMSFDAYNRQIILFGGLNNTTGNLDDTWTLISNISPQITSPNGVTFSQEVFSSFNVTTTGCPAPSINASGTLPSGIDFVDNGNGTGTLSGTPAAGSGGIYTPST